MLSWTGSPWLRLCQSYLRMYVLGKGLVELLRTLRFSFYRFSAAIREVYKVPLNQWGWVLFLLPSDVYVRSSLCPVTLNKILLHKALSDWDCGPRVQSSPLETANLAPNTISSHLLLTLLVWSWAMFCSPLVPWISSFSFSKSWVRSIHSSRANFLQTFYLPVFVLGFLQTGRVLQVREHLHENAWLFSKEFF